MPFALNLIYSHRPVLFSPVLLYRWFARASIARDGAKNSAARPRCGLAISPCLWFHAVSVGEVLLLRPLVREMARRRPNWEVVISTTTSTGLAVARRTFPDLVTFYAPLDFSWATRRAVRRDPADRSGPRRARAMAEPDPGRQTTPGAKVAIINARLSSRSYRGYRSSACSACNQRFDRIDAVAAQNSGICKAICRAGDSR